MTVACDVLLDVNNNSDMNIIVLLANRFCGVIVLRYLPTPLSSRFVNRVICRMTVGLSLCVSVHAVEEKRLELSTPNLVHI